MDKQKLIDMLTGFSIPFEILSIENKKEVVKIITDCEKVQGYEGFFTEFEFNEFGEFTMMGIWE